MFGHFFLDIFEVSNVLDIFDKYFNQALLGGDMLQRGCLLDESSPAQSVDSGYEAVDRTSEASGG